MHFAPASVGPRSAIKSDSYPVREITSELDYSEIDPDKSNRKNLTEQENFFFFPPYMRVVSLIVFPDPEGGRFSTFSKIAYPQRGQWRG